MPARTIRRYSLALKSYIVTEIEAGRLSVEQAQQRFRIRDYRTVYSWLETFGTKAMAYPSVRITEAQLMARRAEQIRRFEAGR